MDTKKKIFISDIHMGTEESIQSERPYGWLLKDRAALLTEFLEHLTQDKNLSELVIVGDLFDEWVVPYASSPVPNGDRGYADQFSKIAAASQNKQIIKALCNLADRDEIRVTYVPGNHDMLLENTIIENLIPNIRPLINGPGKGRYLSGKIAAEHGSYYCLFNAPDTYDNPGHSLPLGFFVARSQAEGVTTGHPVSRKEYIHVFLDALNKMIHKESFADAVFDSIVDQIKPFTDDIVMQGMDAYPESIQTAEVSKLFKGLASNWKKRMSGNVPTMMAAVGEMACLFPAVLQQYALPYFEKKKAENIVILGHTHAWEIRGLSLGLRSLVGIVEDFFQMMEAVECGDFQKALKICEDFSDPGANSPSDFIYANSGTWINGDSGANGGDQPPATFVVVSQEGGKTSVEVRSYNGGDPMQSKLLDSRFSSK